MLKILEKRGSYTPENTVHSYHDRCAPFDSQCLSRNCNVLDLPVIKIFVLAPNNSRKIKVPSFYFHGNNLTFIRTENSYLMPNKPFLDSGCSSKTALENIGRIIFVLNSREVLVFHWDRFSFQKFLMIF